MDARSSLLSQVQSDLEIVSYSVLAAGVVQEFVPYDARRVFILFPTNLQTDYEILIYPDVGNPISMIIPATNSWTFQLSIQDALKLTTTRVDLGTNTTAGNTIVAMGVRFKR